MKKIYQGVKYTVAAGLATAATASHAAVDAAVSTGLTDAATDVATVGGLAFLAVLAGVSFKYMRRGL